MEEVTAALEPRFDAALTIAGTQKHHRFQPVGDGKLEIFETSHLDSSRKLVPICREEDTQTQRRTHRQT